jgi:hypothetical protein
VGLGGEVHLGIQEDILGSAFINGISSVLGHKHKKHAMLEMFRLNICLDSKAKLNHNGNQKKTNHYWIELESIYVH